MNMYEIGQALLMTLLMCKLGLCLVISCIYVVFGLFLFFVACWKTKRICISQSQISRIYTCTCILCLSTYNEKQNKFTSILILTNYVAEAIILPFSVVIRNTFEDVLNYTAYENRSFHPFHIRNFHIPTTQNTKKLCWRKFLCGQGSTVDSYVTFVALVRYY